MYSDGQSEDDGASTDMKLSPNTEPVDLERQCGSAMRRAAWTKGAFPHWIPESAIAIGGRPAIDVSHIAQGPVCFRRPLTRRFLCLVSKFREPAGGPAHNLVFFPPAIAGSPPVLPQRVVRPKKAPATCRKGGRE